MIADKQREAEEKGFAMRNGAEDRILMDKTFHVPGAVGGVSVSNLPPKEKEATAFDQYQRSTTEFTSLVTPHGVTGTGLGAGFGAKEDKRLGFLRPRKTLQPFTGSTSIVPKYDENGLPIDETLTRDQMRRKRLEYMKSIQGTTMSQREHFLLADLDYDKDAILFGRTREEFERNVIKLKEVIIAYNKWERTDNFYYYGSIAVKLATLWVLIECVQQYYDLQLFSSNCAMFVAAMEAEISELEARRRDDLRRAAAQLKHTKPNFQPVLAAIVSEKRAWNEEKKREDDAHLVAALHSSDGGETANPSALDSPKHHPMDTTREEAMKAAVARQQEKREMLRLHNSTVTAENYSLVRTLWHKICGSKVDPTPLQHEDFARFSYAASPTNVEAVRLIRRILVPKSEDYTQVVREEMQQYKQEKESGMGVVCARTA